MDNVMKILFRIEMQTINICREMANNDDENE